MSAPTDLGLGLYDGATGTACVVTDVTVDAEVVALDAAIRLTQRFENPADRAIEAVYVFPLPPLAGVTAIRAVLGGRTVVASLAERGQARADYARAVAEGRRAALAEEERPSTFTMTLGNLAAGETAEVVLELVGPVEVQARLGEGRIEAWEAALRLPTVVAPRYTAGDPLGGPPVGTGTAPDTGAVPDASRVTPPVGIGVAPTLAWTVGLDPAGLPVGAIEAPPGADRTPGADGRVVLSGRGRCDADVTVRWQLAPERIAVAATVTPDGDAGAGREGDATVNVTVVPPVGTTTRRPADVVVTLDRSGSMGGWKIATAVRAAGRLLDALTPTDRVGLVTFDHHVDGAELGLRPVTPETRARLRERLGRIDARGGTELAGAIIAAANLLGRPDPERDRIVLLVTDGQVSGESAAVAAAQAAGARVLVVGVDTAVNHGLLDRLTRSTGGSGTVVTRPDELDRALATVRHRLGAPALEHLRISTAGAVPGTAAGDHRDVVWPDSVARIGLRATAGAGDTVVRLDADGPSGPWHREVVAGPAAGPAGRVVWARARLRDLEDDYDGGGATRPADLVAHSLAHGVLCRFTAFVAVDEEGDTVGDGTPLPTLVQPSELPSGWALPAPAMALSPDVSECVTSALMMAPRPAPARAMRPVLPRALPRRDDFWAERPGDHPGTPGELDRLLGRLGATRLPEPARRFLAAVVALGCRIERGGRDHLDVLPPGGTDRLCRVHVRTGRIEFARGTWSVADGLGAGDRMRRLPGDRAALTPGGDDDVDVAIGLVEALIGDPYTLADW